MKQTSLLGSFVKKTTSFTSSEKNNQGKSDQPTHKKESKNENMSPNVMETPIVEKVENNCINKISKLTINSEPMQNIEQQSEEEYYVPKKKNNKKMNISDNQDDDFEQQQNDRMDIEGEQETPIAKNKGRRATGKSAKKNKNMSKSNHESETPNKVSQSIAEEIEFTDKTPIWALQQSHLDANKNRPGHPDYDPTTLYVPPQEKLTQTMKQYWHIKSKNYDKIVLFKLGKFYELFYEDAAVGNKHLQLKWMGTKMHTGFPEKKLDKYSHKFVELGYRVVIVEQLETADKMKQRLQNDKTQGRKSLKTLERGVTQILTKGTIISFEDDNQYLSNYLISIHKQGNSIAYSLLEISTNQILLGYSSTLQDFKTMLFQTRPVELLYDPDNLPIELLDIMKQNWLNMIHTKLTNKENFWHPLNSKNQIDEMNQAGKLPKLKIFEVMKEMGDQGKMIYSSLSGMFKYLKNCIKFDYIMSSVKFQFYQKQQIKHTMVLDSQALHHLELFETPLGEKDSLFFNIDHTRTKFGKRLLRRWLMQPLLSVKKINERLNAVEDLEGISMDRATVQSVFSKLPDLEKIVNRLYHYSVKTIAQKAVYFEDVSGTRLKEFRQLIENFRISWSAIQTLRKSKDKFRSKRLIQLLTLEQKQKQQQNEIYDSQNEQQEHKGQLPSIFEHYQEFRSYIKWNGDVPEPQKGLVTSFDNLQDELCNLKRKMESYLESVIQKTGVTHMKFVHAKQKYEIEIPESKQGKIKNDSEMIFTSKRQGFSRYVTKQSRKMVDQMEDVEQMIKQQMGLFVGFFFEEFRKKQRVWEKYIRVLAELDCLLSLSSYSFKSIEAGVRPQFCDEGFNIHQAKHPCLNVTDVIANDISLDQRIMLLTGPNMGGKSTILRTTCILTIMAQVGLFVPAQSYKCCLVDRIFTRIGASDKLEEGKSTFFIEMEETKSILKHATKNSLAIMDQLGRGTSTFDGMAIAFSVLKELLQNIQCRCIFATHYHSLSSEFSSFSNISMRMMNYLIKDEKVIFLYKLKEGNAGQSFGMNVAKVVKMPQRIIAIAEGKAKEMEQEIKKKDEFKKVKMAYDFIHS